MKIQVLLLSAVFLFISGIVSAAHVIDEETYNLDDFVWSTPANSRIVSVRLNYGNQTDFKYAVYDVSKYGVLSEIDDLFSEESLESNSGSIWLLQPGVNTINLSGEVKQLGVVAYQPDDVRISFSGDNPDSNFMFYRAKINPPPNAVIYGKLDDNGDGNDYSADILFGSPLPSPVVTLLIALGLGSALVMYRKRRQTKA